MKRYKIISSGKEVGNILEQHKFDGNFVANVTINKFQISGQKRFSDLMQGSVIGIPEILIRAKTKNELDDKVNDFINLHIQQEFKIVEQ
ncbi:hypothetical protein [Draconibacterium sp.]|uniref:hypothetical protein n=1 Tax=Draconibacterium sp. TaxID=1965318 RepID=UPI003564097F